MKHIIESIKYISKSDKKQLVGIFFWFAAGAAMIIMGIAAIINCAKAILTISNIIGGFSLITGTITLIVRFYQSKVMKKGFRLDFIIWFVLAFLFFNTVLLQKLGKIAFIIIGAAVLISSVNMFISAMADKRPAAVILPLFPAVLGLWVIFNAEAVFTNMAALAVGIYLIIHGLIITYEWVGRVKYFRNFRGLE